MASDDDRSEKSDDSRRKSRKMSDDDKSRSRSRSRSPQRENQERVTKVIDIATDDAAFVLGRGGATKRKIARVSGANIELDEHALTITLNGTEKQCNHAIDYIDFIKQQRVGPVTIDMERSRGDFTGYTVLTQRMLKLIQVDSSRRRRLRAPSRPPRHRRDARVVSRPRPCHTGTGRLHRRRHG